MIWGGVDTRLLGTSQGKQPAAWLLEKTSIFTTRRIRREFRWGWSHMNKTRLAERPGPGHIELENDFFQIPPSRDVTTFRRCHGNGRREENQSEAEGERR
ncbi:hypothetical protein Bbelb_250720 [Branchiostoma belcheri]|nr:hypothetical protein Bbelb_250720 [Branchiostoma belcheri]